MKLSQDFLNELKMRNDIESVISPYVALKKRGANLIGLCPFHNEKTPSFTVWPENGSFYCFGCGAGGDAITFLMQIEHLDYMEAVKTLAERSGMSLPVDNSVDDKIARLKSQIYDANKAAARFFYENLIAPQGKEALNYLTGRGLAPKTIKQFGLGFAPDSWDALVKHLKGQGFSDYVLVEANLAVRSKKGSLIDRFRNRVMFPVIDLRGNFIAFSGRKLREEDIGGKYINTSETAVYKKGANVFGLNFAKAHSQKRVVLVEGNMDVISLHQAGFPMTVAPLGTAFTADQARLLARYTDEVVITLDADSAGQKATDKVLRILEDAGVKARILRLPECKDPDEFIKKKGAARFEALLDGAISDIEYKLHTASEGIDLQTSDGKLEYLKKAVVILASLSDEIARDLYAGRLSESCGVGKEAIITNVKKQIEKNKKQVVRKELDKIVNPTFDRNDPNPEKRSHPRAAAAEEMLIAVLILHPDMYDEVTELISPEDFVTEFNKRVFSDVLEVLSEGRPFDISALGSDYTPREIGYVTMLENTLPLGENLAKTITSSAAVIKEEKLISSTHPAELETDEWAERMKALARGKINKG